MRLVVLSARVTQSLWPARLDADIDRTDTAVAVTVMMTFVVIFVAIFVMIFVKGVEGV
ncbi:MAG: hypothetical protein ACI81O_002471 [Cyclobacteriaceae bacterium]|jgi:hypothetical protein